LLAGDVGRSREEVWYNDHMTILTHDVELAKTHETAITRPVMKMRSKWLTASHWVELAVSAVLWGSLLMAASGLGLLLDAMWETVRKL